jgi:hypothetical protein
MPLFFKDSYLFILLFLAIIALIAIAVVIAGVIKRRKEIEAYKSAIEKGMPISEVNLGKSPINTLKSGLVWIAVGIGLFIMILAGGNTKALSASAIPLLIGIALVISYFIEKRANGK